MSKFKYFLCLFVACLILLSFVNCVNGESNVNETNNNEIIVTSISNNETINDNVRIINNETVIIPTVVNNTENITIVNNKTPINVTDDLNNYNTGGNGYSDSDKNNILIKNKNNDLIKVKLNDTNNYRGDIAFGTVGLCYSVAILYLLSCLFY